MPAHRFGRTCDPASCRRTGLQREHEDGMGCGPGTSDRRLRLHKMLLCSAGLVLGLLGPARDEEQKPYDPSAVEGRLDVHEGFASEALGNRRRLFVLLPPGYEESADRRYPVIYALDGQDLFDDSMAAGGEEWMVDELLARRPPGVPEVLVVGIEAVPQAVREYAPPGSREDARGDDLVRFLTREVKPFVDRAYRTRARDALLMGQGVGAVMAMYAAWTHPEVFAGAIALEFPDVDAVTVSWTQVPPGGRRPWLWVEQKASSRARPSTTQLVATLRRHADVRVIVTGERTSRPARLLAALRAMPAD